MTTKAEEIAFRDELLRIQRESIAMLEGTVASVSPEVVENEPVVRGCRGEVVRVGPVELETDVGLIVTGVNIEVALICRVVVDRRRDGGARAGARGARS